MLSSSEVSGGTRLSTDSLGPKLEIVPYFYVVYHPVYLSNERRFTPRSFDSLVTVPHLGKSTSLPHVS